MSLMGKVIKDQGKTIGSEFKDILHSPFENPKKTAKWGLLIGGLVLIDKPLTQFYQQRVEPALGWKLNSISPTFDHMVLAAQKHVVAVSIKLD